MINENKCLASVLLSKTGKCHGGWLIKPRVEIGVAKAIKNILSVILYMICHKHKCIFVHIPKTAGISIEHVFAERNGLAWENRSPLLLGLNPDPALGPPRLAHLTAAQYLSCGHISQELFDTYFKFSFVRNPWDRIVSEYKYRRHPQLYDFKTFLFKYFPREERSDAFCHVLPQYGFLYDKNGKQLVDYIGKFEDIQQGFNEVCERINIPQQELPHINKSSGFSGAKNPVRFFLKKMWNWRQAQRVRRNTYKHYSSYYDDEAREFVAELYARDIVLFGYKFETAADTRR